MNKNFLSFIDQGVEKAQIADQHLNTVDKLFGELNKQLAEYRGGGIKMYRASTTLARFLEISQVIAADKPELQFLTQDRIMISATNKTAIEVAKWRQDVKGFPCMLRFEGDEYICDNVDELRAALEALVSTVGFGRAVTKILEQPVNALVPKDPI